MKKSVLTGGLFLFAWCSIFANSFTEALDAYYWNSFGGIHGSRQEAKKQFADLQKMIKSDVKDAGKSKDLARDLQELKKKDSSLFPSGKDLGTIHTYCSEQQCVFMVQFDPLDDSSGVSVNGKYIYFRNVIEELDPKLFDSDRMTYDKRQKKIAALRKKLGKYQTSLNDFTLAYKELRKKFAALGGDEKKEESSAGGNPQLEKLASTAKEIKILDAEIHKLLDNLNTDSISTQERKALIQLLTDLNDSMSHQFMYKTSGGHTYRTSGPLSYRLRQLIEVEKDRLVEQ